MTVSVELRRHRTGLWTATLKLPCYPLTIRGYLTCEAAQAAARPIALYVFGRTPSFTIAE